MDDIARSVTLASLSQGEQGVGHQRARGDRRRRAVPQGHAASRRRRCRPTTGNLSGGNQQKVVLSKWIFADPDVLILDEPTRGIDVGAKYEIYTIINELAAQGKAVIVISSELPELIGLCDRIYTLNEGRLTGEVARADATQETLMRYMMKGRDLDDHHLDGEHAAVERTARRRHRTRRVTRAVGDRCRATSGSTAWSSRWPLIVRPVPDLDRRHPAQAAQRHQHRSAERLHPDPRDRDGHRHHLRPHRPVGRFDRRLHRRDVRRS